jgi:hypothetical protein
MHAVLRRPRTRHPPASPTTSSRRGRWSMARSRSRQRPIPRSSTSCAFVPKSWRRTARKRSRRRLPGEAQGRTFPDFWTPDRARTFRELRPLRGYGRSSAVGSPVPGRSLSLSGCGGAAASVEDHRSPCTGDAPAFPPSRASASAPGPQLLDLGEDRVEVPMPPSVQFGDAGRIVRAPARAVLNRLADASEVVRARGDHNLRRRRRLSHGNIRPSGAPCAGQCCRLRLASQNRAGCPRRGFGTSRA